MGKNDRFLVAKTAQGDCGVKFVCLLVSMLTSYFNFQDFIQSHSGFSLYKKVKCGIRISMCIAICHPHNGTPDFFWKKKTLI